MYRGAFGCHVSGVLRRLLRLCRHYQGGTLATRVVCCSATIANPADHMVNLTGLSVDDLVVVDEDGAPMGFKQFCLWNPPMANEDEQGKENVWDVSTDEGDANASGATDSKGVVVRRSSYKDTAMLLAELIKRDIRTLVFVKVRSFCALL